MAKVDGFSDLEFDVAKQTCSFKVTDPDLDFEARLAEFATTNSKIEGYKVL